MLCTHEICWGISIISTVQLVWRSFLRESRNRCGLHQYSRLGRFSPDLGWICTDLKSYSYIVPWTYLKFHIKNLNLGAFSSRHAWLSPWSRSQQMVKTLVRCMSVSPPHPLISLMLQSKSTTSSVDQG